MAEITVLAISTLILFVIVYVLVVGWRIMNGVERELKETQRVIREHKEELEKWRK